MAGVVTSIYGTDEAQWELSSSQELTYMMD